MNTPMTNPSMPDDPLKIPAACPRCGADLTVTADPSNHMKTVCCDVCGVSASDVVAREAFLKLRPNPVPTSLNGPSDRCLFLGCPSPMAARGLCRSHYQMALRLIRRGLTSWKSLEGQSKAAPPGRRPSADQQWFLSQPPNPIRP